MRHPPSHNSGPQVSPVWPPLGFLRAKGSQVMVAETEQGSRMSTKNWSWRRWGGGNKDLDDRGTRGTPRPRSAEVAKGTPGLDQSGGLTRGERFNWP